MGRLGGGELGYGSDADVMFVCDPIEGTEGTAGVDESAAVRWSVTIAEQVQYVATGEHARTRRYRR